ncbi:MAG: RNA-splicing ligase RtcB [DPANN group archaeon]|nr:RNA-splicing ligase RtcB [DPANN group archaeon]
MNIHEEREPIEPVQIDDIRWEIPKEGGMHVPARIFASEKILRFMKRDKSLFQIKNVAYLPGIHKHAIIMPDGHQGYGFPIGGVAALDVEKGGISPGGIGYDINCLAGDTRIVDGYGTSHQVKDIETFFTEEEQESDGYVLKTNHVQLGVLTLDPRKKRMTSRPVPFFMKKQADKRMLDIRTVSGHILTLSEDHPVLTRQGMVPAGLLTEDQEIATSFFEGLPYVPLPSTILVEDLPLGRQARTFFCGHGLLPLRLNNPKLPILSRLLGYLFGDGLVYFAGSKGRICAYGKQEDLEQMKDDFASLGFRARIYSRTRTHTINGKAPFSATTSELQVSSTGLARLLISLGMPEGNKTNQAYDVPSWILRSPPWIQRLFLAGFFGAEMSAPATGSRTCFYHPTISMNKNMTVVEDGRKFFISLMRLLESLGVQVQKISQTSAPSNREGPVARLKLLLSSKEEHLLTLYGKIGFAYNRRRQETAMIAVAYLHHKQRVLQKRTEAERRVRILKKKGLSMKEAQECLCDETVNARFVERHYYAKRPSRISQQTVSFQDFRKVQENDLQRYGTIFDRIEHIGERSYDGLVYDLNVQETHNFVANGLIVSNCGVRLLRTDLKKEDVKDKVRPLISLFYKNCPVGLGVTNVNVDYDQLELVLEKGARWAVDNGYGTEDDLIHCEEEGAMEQADPSRVSDRAKKRGKRQLATIGSGNHFVELQYVEEIFDEEAAKAFGIEEGQVCVMIHCGSRGLGHQTCSDYLREMEKQNPDLIAQLPDRELVYAPSGSKVAKDYLGAMAAAANFAWCNRHMLGHLVRQSINELFPDAKVETVYDIAHNIAKVEEHEVDGKKVQVYVHRKGATRAFGPGRKEIPEDYRKVGQPVIIPGSMGTASWLLHGTEQSMKESFGSTAHGAGRMMSRSRATREFKGEDIVMDLEKKGIIVKGASWKGIAEEAPLAYKDVDEVIETTHKAGIAKKVARLRPMGVVKG